MGLPKRSGSSDILHMPQTDLNDVETTSLDSHRGHLLPDRIALDKLDSLEGVVHLSQGEVEGEVHHRFSCVLITLFETGKLAKSPAHDQSTDGFLSTYLLVIELGLKDRMVLKGKRDSPFSRRTSAGQQLQ